MKTRIGNEVDRFYKFTLVAVDPDDITKTMEYYPKTYDDLVYLDKYLTESKHDRLIPYHVSEEDRELLNKSPLEGGLVKLNEYGYIPIEYFDSTLYALVIEFNNVTDLLKNSNFGDDRIGRLVMVRDDRDDPIGKVYNTNKPYWCIYRFLGTDSHLRENWQKLIREVDLDVIHKWNEIEGIPRSTIEDIQEMVRVKHEHFNIDTLNSFKENSSHILEYKGIEIKTRENFRSITATKDPYVGTLPGDLVLHITSTKMKEVEDKTPIIIEGNCDELFADIVDLEESPLLSSVNATSMRGLFSGCTSLKSVSWFNTSLVEDTSYMYYNCKKLETIMSMDLINDEYADYMFAYCSLLSSARGLEFSNKLKSSKGMFLYCIDLTSLSNINSSNLEDTSEMFCGCEHLSELPYINYGSTKNTSYMFKGCRSIERISDVNTSNAINMTEMFSECYNLKYINGIDFSSAKTLTNIFNECSNLETVDIVPYSLKTSISFANTKLTESSLISIIDNLPTLTNDTASITVTGTPASKITAIKVTEANGKGWNIIR